MSSSGIDGYTYQGEHLCPGCTLNAVSGNSTAAVEFDFNVEAIDSWLRTTAAQRGIDFDDEVTYDSEVFPKALTYRAPGERCVRCRDELRG